MPRGYIDAMTCSGLIEGWAYDEQKPLEPLLVTIIDVAENLIATGLANLYRKDLAEKNHGYGWCHFRLSAHKPKKASQKNIVSLVAANSKAVLHSAEISHPEIMRNSGIGDIAELIGTDPTVINSLDQIETFEEIFNNFIRSRGVDAFVRAAYVYVLGRSIDDSGILLYSRLIRQARLSPYAMLRTLADSAEFKERPRSLIAPTQPGFPFRIG